jgi:hypothetical protein
MKPIEQARAEMTAAGAKAEHAEFMAHAGKILDVAMQLKKAMMDRNKTVAKAICPFCNVSGALHGRLVTGSAAGRHRRTGGAFRMWCDNCPGVRMME